MPTRRIPVDQLGRQAILFDDPKNLPQDLAGAQGLGQLASIWGAKPTGIYSRRSAARPSSSSSPGLRERPDDADRAVHHASCRCHGTRRFSIRDKNLTVGDGVTDFRAISATNPGDLGYFYRAG